MRATAAGGWVARVGRVPGRAGIALALGYLGDVTQDARFTRLARATLRTQARLLGEEPGSVVGLGILNGWGGILYALTHLGVLWNDDALLDEAAGYARRLRPLVEKDTVLDVGAGAAGCLLALLALGEHRPSDALWATAEACGQRLLETATPPGPRRGLDLRERREPLPRGHGARRRRNLPGAAAAVRAHGRYAPA
ncbi:lanthionine synthetase LanC family protein [Myxococcus sp. 1LA]